MPKQDRFASMKKDADKNRGKMNAQKRKDEKVAEKAQAVEVPEVTTRPRSTNGSGKKGMEIANTTFAKAAAVSGDAEEEEEEYEEEEAVYEEEETYEAAAVQESTSKGSSKKETKETQKSKKQQKKDELQLLAAEAAEAKKQRIKDKLLNAFMIGIVMDYMKPKASSSNGSHPPQKKKNKKASDDDSSFSIRGVKEKVNVFQGPFLVLVVIAAVIYGKVMEDSYGGGFEYDLEDNFYDVMGLARDASIVDVRKKYKALAVSWHPDRNPGCATCEEKFASISKAYNVLSDPEQKKAYDNQRSTKGAQSSASSHELSSENFEAKVLRSNEVWVVQVYDPSESHSSSFHPLWEENANQLQHVAKFGRLDASKHKAALNFFPQRIVIKPVVFRFARGYTTEDYLWTGDDSGYGSASAPLGRFILDSFPGMQHMEDVAEIERWWSGSGRPRLLIAGSGSAIKRGAQNQQFLPVLRMAHLWSEFFEIVAADSSLVQKALSQHDIKLPGSEKKNSRSWSVLWLDSVNSKVEVKSIDDLKELPSQIEEVIQEALAVQAPLLTVRNHRQLCEAGSESRTFCLVLTDTYETQVSQVLADLASSRSAYAKEVQEMRDAEQEVTEEPFRIQVVRVSTSTSRLPSKPVSVAPAFYAAWAEVQKSQMFMVELDTQRVTEVKPSVLKDVYQQVAYEDLKFKELPEGVSFVRGLPDPEASVSRELFRFLTTAFGAFFAYVLLAVIIAVGPELRLPEKLGAAGIILVFIFLASPFACRRVLELVM